jgi:thiol-disulfide isomerase/thioredoxin
VSLSLSFYVGGQNVRAYDITGKLNTDYNGPINLRYEIAPDSLLSYQSISKNGNFTFKVKLAEAVPAILSLPLPANSDYIYLDTASMAISADIDSTSVNGKSIKFIKIVNVKGSKSQDTYAALMAAWNRISDSGLPQKLQSENLFEILDSLVKLYPDHNIIPQALYFAEILSYQQASKIFEQLTRRQKNRSNINGINKVLKRLERTDIGVKVILRDLENESGKSVTLEAISPSVVLLDFWASWCYPCRAKHPELKKIYKKYSSKGFNIISISLDSNKDQWLKAIKEDSIDWVNASDLKGYAGYIPSFYYLNYVPFNLLLDSTGRIIGKNVTPNEIKMLLENGYFDN